MTSIEAAMIERLKAYAQSQGQSPVKMFQLRAPGNPRTPYAVMFRVTGNPVSGFGSDCALVRSRWQVDVYGKNADEMIAARRQLVGAFQRWRQDGPLKVQASLIEAVGPDNWLDDPDLARGVLDLAIDYEGALA